MSCLEWQKCWWKLEKAPNFVTRPASNVDRRTPFGSEKNCGMHISVKWVVNKKCEHCFAPFDIVLHCDHASLRGIEQNASSAFLCLETELVKILCREKDDKRLSGVLAVSVVSSYFANPVIVFRVKPIRFNCR
jgi:hypothetical protein